MVITKPALAATHPKMRPTQGFGHAAGRNPINLHHKNNKNQCTRKGSNEPFGIMINGIDSFMAAGY